MKEINDPDEFYPYPGVFIDKYEFESIRNELLGVLKRREKQYEKYVDLLNSGFATDDQVDKLVTIERKLEVLSRFCNMSI